MAEALETGGPTRHERPLIGSTAHNYRRGIILVGVATFIWSTTSLFIDKLITGYHMTALQTSLSRTFLVTLALGLFLALQDRGQFRLYRREIPFYLIYGLIGIGFFNLIWSISVEINKAAVATALIFCAPVFVAVGARFLFKEKLEPVQLMAIGINLIGCGLVAGVTDPAALLASPAGLIVGLASGLCFAFSTLLGKIATEARRRSSGTILFYTFLFGTLGLLVWSLLSEGPGQLIPTLDWGGWALLFGLSLGPTLGGYAFFTAGLRALPAPLVSLLTTLEPPITAVLAFFILNRVMNGLQWLGTGLIVGGVMVMQLITARRQKV
jgi:drug/metabolite transporter (DMT)-like permease